MRNQNQFGKTILSLLGLFLFFFSAYAKQTQSQEQEQVIDMGTYKLSPPPGKGWEIETAKEKGFVSFKKKEAGLLRQVYAQQRATIIEVYRDLVPTGGWYMSEEEAANNVRDQEERIMVESGVKTGQYKLKDVKKDIIMLEDRKLYFMSYKMTFNPGLQKITIDATLYLYFPPDFQKKHTFYGILYSYGHPSAKTGAVWGHAEQQPVHAVIKSLQIVDPLASIAGPDGEFLRAAAAGDNAGITKSLENGANINATSSEGTALMIAALYGHQETLDLLTENGADINRTGGESGWNALYQALAGRELEIAKDLIEKGIDINLQTKDGLSALMLAASIGLSELVQFMIEKGADVNAKNNQGATPLSFAAINGKTECVALLLARGADVNVRGDMGWTPLMDAIDRGFIEIANMLLDNGADANIKSDKGWTALCAAVLRKNLHAVQLLLEKGADAKLLAVMPAGYLHQFFAEGPAEVVRMLIEGGADINIKNIDGSTALMEAVRQGNVEVVKLLIENGADINAKDKAKNTAMKIAKKKNQQAILKLLKDAGAKE